MLKNEKGITLLEVMAATVILTLVVLAFVGISGYVGLSNQKSDRSTEALQLAETQLNIIRDYVKTSKTIPADPMTLPVNSPYHVTIHPSVPLASSSTATMNYKTDEIRSQQVSIQAEVLLQNAPSLVTVTVSWEK